MSHRPFIKSEPDEAGLHQQYFAGNSAYSQGIHAFSNSYQQQLARQQQQQQQQQQHNAGVDSLSSLQQQGQQGQQGQQESNFMNYGYNSQQQNLSSNFGFGNSSIDTSELLDLDLNRSANNMSANQNNSNNHISFLPPAQTTAQNIAMSVPASNNMGSNTALFSSTHPGEPIQAPFIRNNLDYNQFRDVSNSVPNPQNAAAGASPGIASLNAAFETSLFSHRGRQIMQGGMGPSRSRFGSLDMTPYSRESTAAPTGAGSTALANEFAVGTPESGSYPRPVGGLSLHNRHKLSGQWDSTAMSQPSLSQHSLMDSPQGSPRHQSFAELYKSGKHTSLPSKVDPATLESQEAKRRRRRASHNMVERRRRDNINERIHELSHLVPQHRLEDDKVRKQLLNNASLSAVTSGMSPPQSATSLLAGGTGRRAAGNITMGLPIEEKEKGPNKGDILNGSVAWTRDLMWALHIKLQQEAELAELIARLGGTWPFEQTEEEKRMRTELMEAMEKNDPNTFSYSRGPGSGLRVPKHTNLAGEPLQAQDQMQQDQGQNQQQQQQQQQQPQQPPVTDSMTTASLSPAFTSGGSGTNSGNNDPGFQQEMWGNPAFAFREEDEYAMEI
ncbi:HLH transcription factor (GlcD gamma) [Ascosphaera apis ARSEF 7405]|uniref:HLH transcription factor (GlcD gamma) n=1 Tax=Ascosphaera apis ARSEF 7405 TaxID=392613 RepID=A0A167Z8U1_9EURO|nr:HLH transcription factor (GlcD gamma) [Ascosphaera apis ARSEF 7405]